jgi:hypothetical protein
MTKIAGSGSQSRSISQRHGPADPDPHQNVMDPEHFFKGSFFFFLRLGPNFPAEQQAPDGQQWAGHRHLLLRQEAQLQGARGTVPVPARRNPGLLSKLKFSAPEIISLEIFLPSLTSLSTVQYRYGTGTCSPISRPLN